MTKIVYNACHGGFSVSREAVLLGRQLSGDPMWGGPSIQGDVYKSGELVTWDYGHLDDMPRHDPILVRVVEILGDKANGSCAKLKIEEFSGRMYRIEKYDGRETVCGMDDYNWIIIDEAK